MNCRHMFGPNKMGGDAEIICLHCKMPYPTQVERDYEAGRWVPSYYGNKFTVAQNKPARVLVELEQDTSFKVATLSEAQAEADRRNLDESIERDNHYDVAQAQADAAIARVEGRAQ